MTALFLFCSLSIVAMLHAEENSQYDAVKLEDEDFTTQSSQPFIDNNMKENSSDENNNSESEEIIEDLEHLNPVIETISTSHSKPAINPFFILNNKKKIPLYFLYKFNQHVLRPLQEKWQEFNTFLAYPFNQNIGVLCMLNHVPVFGNLKDRRSFWLNGALNSIHGFTYPPPLCPFQYGSIRKDKPHVYQLLNKEDMDFDIEEPKYSGQMAENINSFNSSVCNFEERLSNKKQINPEEEINMLQREIENHPTDINLRLRLLRNLVKSNRISEVYKNINNMEDKNLWLCHKHPMWYETVANILIHYKNQTENLPWLFWFTFISTLDKVLELRLDENSEKVEESLDYLNQLFLFDQSLHEASENIKDCPGSMLSSEFLNHYRGQLYFHFATTILKQAKKNFFEFKEATAIILPLLFAAYDLKPVDPRALWVNRIEEPQKKLLRRWHLEGAFRCSQCGHILLAAAKDGKYVVIAKATKHLFGMWQERLFNKVFVFCL